MKLSTWFLCIVFVAAGISARMLAQTTMVTADFGNRTNYAHPIPPRMFGTNMASIQTSNTAALLAEAGMSEGRRIANIPVVYAKNTPDWTEFDWAMNQAKAASIHPVVVMTNTPSWLQPIPNPCGGASPNQMAAPTSVSKWATIAASYVAHLNLTFPGLVKDYEIWNEPELQKSFCVADNTDGTRLKTYLALYAAAASAMQARARQDGVTIRIGGPTISRLALAPTWISGLLSNPQTAPYVDFVTFHFYPTGLKQIQEGMTWNSLYTRTQSDLDGLTFHYSRIASLVRNGSQPNPSNTPIYITEYNDNWSFTPDCCRNHSSYAPLWNATVVADLLNTAYTGAKAPGKIYYYSGHMPPFCMFGMWNASMDCSNSTMDPYPQYYLYQLIASSGYLGLEAGGYMASSVTPATTQSGLMATAFYTANNDSLVIVNPTATHYTQTTVIVKNSGFGPTETSLYLLDSGHGQINTRSLNLANGTDGLSAIIDVPAHSTVALAITGSTSSQAPIPVLDVTPQSGVAPLKVTVSSARSSDLGGSISSRSTTYGDGSTFSPAVASAHTYTSAGAYTVKLTVTDNSGLTSQATKVVTVSAPSGTVKAVLGVSPRVGTAPLQVRADSGASSGPISSRNITFGDGSAASTAVSPIHTYNASGTYTIKLTITSNAGLTAQTTQTVRVEAIRNSGFESGLTGWSLRSATDGLSYTIPLNAHSGSGYVELTATPGSHPELFALGSENTQYFSVLPGQTVTFGGWAYLVSGNGLGRWAIELTDANKNQPTYVPAVSGNAAKGNWVHQQRTFVVPAGKTFLRLYGDIYRSTIPTTVRFDDVALQIH